LANEKDPSGWSRKFYGQHKSGRGGSKFVNCDLLFHKANVTFRGHLIRSYRARSCLALPPDNDHWIGIWDEPNQNPFRRQVLLLNIWDDRAEGLARLSQG
jgi:hypothetical protein